jgi:hypothetical protein
MTGECVVDVEMSEFVEELQFTPGEGFSKRGQEKPSKQARQHPHGQKEARPACDPP